jgi:hypothetical protein
LYCSQEIQIQPKVFSDQHANLSRVLQNISDLTQQAIVDAIQLDAANGFLADALERESGQREAGGQAVLQHLHNLSDDAACHSVTSGRAAIQEALSKAQDILSSQSSSDKESKFQLEQSTNLLEKATEQAKFLSEGVQNQLQDNMNELSTVVAGFQSAKEGLDVSLSQNVEAQDVIEQALRELIVRTHFDSMLLNFVKIAWPFGWSMRRMEYENENYDYSGIFLRVYVKIYPNRWPGFWHRMLRRLHFQLPSPLLTRSPIIANASWKSCAESLLTTAKIEMMQEGTKAETTKLAAWASRLILF